MSELDDATIRLALELQRVSAHEETRALDIIAELEADLRRLLAERNLSDAAKRDIETLLKAAEDAINGRYDTIAGLLDTKALVETVARITGTQIALVSARAIELTEHRIASLANSVLIDGSPAKAWWERQAEDLRFRFAAQVRQGIAAGETQERIVARITGRPGEPGIMETTRRATRALVHSSVMSAANHARLATFRANPEMFAGVKWLSTLDGHTCLQCAALDGARWDLDGKPQGNSHFTFQAPPAHMRCRCTLTGIPRGLDEIFGEGLGLDDLAASMSRRVSSSGRPGVRGAPQPGSTTFSDFLARQDRAFVERVLGERRAELYRQGKLTLTDLVSGTGRPLTLVELAARGVI